MRRCGRDRSILLCTLFLATAVAFCQTDGGNQRASESAQSALNDSQMSVAGPSSQETAELGPEIKRASHDSEGQLSGGNDGGTIVVHVWSSTGSKTNEPDPAVLSRGFAVAALSAASRLQFTERRIANSIKQGFPLGEFWIQTDFDSIDDSLRVASLSATNDADRQTLQQLQTQTQRLRLWSDWLINQNRRLALADYYTSPARLDNDESFQSAVGCTNFLLSTLASGKTAENSSCY